MAFAMLDSLTRLFNARTCAATPVSVSRVLTLLFEVARLLPSNTRAQVVAAMVAEVSFFRAVFRAVIVICLKVSQSSL